LPEGGFELVPGVVELLVAIGDGMSARLYMNRSLCEPLNWPTYNSQPGPHP
jgi:hypothetical protein